MRIIETENGRAIEHDGQQFPLPALAVDTTVHAYTTPGGLWVGVQKPGEPRPVYPGSGGEWLGPIELPADEAEAAKDALEQRRNAKLNEINAAYTAAAQPLVKEYPEVETKGWDQQKADAEAYLAWHETQQGEPPTMMVLDRILAGRNGDNGTETLYELCLAVQRNAAAFAEFQVLTGKRQRLAKAARSAETLEVLDAIQW